MNKTIATLTIFTFLSWPGAPACGQERQGAALAPVVTSIVQLNAPRTHRRHVPISVELKPLDVVGPGKQRLAVDVTPKGKCDHVEVLLTASEGLTVDGGTTAKWQERAGATARHEVTLGITGPGGRRLAVLVTMCDKGSRQSAIFVYHLHPDGTVASRIEDRHGGSRIVEGPGSRRVLVVPGRETNR